MSDNDLFGNEAWKKQSRPPYTPPDYNQPNYNQPNYNQSFPPLYQNEPVDLSGSQTAYVCGIIGIIMFWNPVGVVLNMIALVKGGTGMSEYGRMRERFTESSFRKASSGRSLGLTCLILFGIVYLGVVLFTLTMK